MVPTMRLFGPRIDPVVKLSSPQRGRAKTYVRRIEAALAGRVCMKRIVVVAEHGALTDRLVGWLSGTNRVESLPCRAIRSWVGGGAHAPELVVCVTDAHHNANCGNCPLAAVIHRAASTTRLILTGANPVAPAWAAGLVSKNNRISAVYPAAPAAIQVAARAALAAN